ncbi:MAG: cytochrome c biogenesis protein CcsA [Candidatus Aminicenantes bacterium]|nr:cytochrome c biogenesis protein CcsA [Candidatus Aminicenantes bacterium]
MIEIRNKKRAASAPNWLAMVIAVVICAAAGSAPAYAEITSLTHFQQLAIMEEGRLKPLDTFARNLLKQFSGQGKFNGERAINWLARVLFTPQNSFGDKVFLITNQEVLESINVKREGKARGRYSFSQLRPGLMTLRQLAIKASKIDPKDRPFVENEILALYNKLYIYQQLLSSFDFVFSHPDFAVKESETLRLLDLPADKKQFSFFDLVEKKEKIWKAISTLEDKEPGELSAVENELMYLKRRLEKKSRLYGELPLTIIPPGGKAKQEEEKWLHSWNLMAHTVIAPGMPFPKLLYLVRDFVTAYMNEDQAGFDKALQDFNARIREKTGASIRPGAVSLEVFYNRVDPFYKGKFFYGFSVIFLLLSFVALKKWFYRFAFLLLGLGFVLHLWGTIARMYIMLRPPVTNLYETFIFTGLTTVLLGMILEFFKKRNIGVLTGSLSGLVMLMIAGKYAMEGDTMGMLMAVLDSNFWLAAHVITIILGYAGIVLSGFIGHVYILQKIFSPGKKEVLKNTFQAVYSIQAFGIVFTFIGTVLGGIWADQSWGRFWGWDPKENGALLILLLSAILFHAKMAGWIKENGMAFGSVVGVIAVALAWFGVNLLGVGLHSYGFTSGVARSLFLFIAFELLFMTAAFLTLQFYKKEVGRTA